jgi:hypothetical protein
MDMSNSGAQRTPLVSGISFVGADGEGHVTVAGEKVTVAAEDVQHFDWVHDATPEAQHAAQSEVAKGKAVKAEPAKANAKIA